MATPSFSECWSQLTNAIKIADTIYTHSVAYDALQDTATQALEGDYAGSILNGMSSTRGGILSSLNSCKTSMDGAIRQLGKVIGSTSRAVDTILDDLYDYMVDASYEVLERDITRSAITANDGGGGSNVGNGIGGTGGFHTLNTDDEDLEIELGLDYNPAAGTNVWDFTALCTSDNSAAGTPEGKATFEITSDDAPQPDILIPSTGTTASAQVYTACAEDGGLIKNPTFEQYASGFTSWISWDGATTYGSWTGITQDTTSTYGFRPKRGSKTVSNPTGSYYSAKFATASDKMFQWINPDISRPLFVGVVHKADATGDGNIKITLGGVSYTQAVANAYTFAVLNATTAKNAWYKNYKPGDGSKLKLQIERDTATAGNVYVSAVIVGYYEYFQGRYIFITTGTTDFERGDYFTYTDTVPADAGTTQSYISKFYNKYLPAASSASAETPDFTP